MYTLTETAVCFWFVCLSGFGGNNVRGVSFTEWADSCSLKLQVSKKLFLLKARPLSTGICSFVVPERILNSGCDPIYNQFMQREVQSVSESWQGCCCCQWQIMGCFKSFVIMELNSVLAALTQAYCEQLYCCSHCGLFEEAMHTHKHMPVLLPCWSSTQTALYAQKHTGHLAKLAWRYLCSVFIRLPEMHIQLNLKFSTSRRLYWTDRVLEMVSGQRGRQNVSAVDRSATLQLPYKVMQLQCMSNMLIYGPISVWTYSAI